MKGVGLGLIVGAVCGVAIAEGYYFHAIVAFCGGLLFMIGDAP